MDAQIPTITVKCVPVTQPIGTFYVGAMRSEDLIDIAWTDVRRIAPKDSDLLDRGEDEGPPPIINNGFGTAEEMSEHDEGYIDIYDQDFEQFLGIQRELSKTRLKKIQQYVTNVDAAFPTAVLLAVSSRQAEYDEEESVLKIVKHSKAAKVIDGQHRIAGLREYSGDARFDINVSIFIDMDIQDQAMVFATINLTQTKVNKSLAYDLYEFTTTRSPQKTAHDVARFLNYKMNSPLENKIKMLGTGSASGHETLTQAAFVDRLLRYISNHPMHDRDLLRRRKRLDRGSESIKNRLIFRDLFIDQRDTQIIIILWNYFLAVQNRWPNSWKNPSRGNVLNRTTGFAALMRFLRVAYRSIGKPSHVVLATEFKPIFDSIELEDETFTPDDYLPGGSGERILYQKLIEQSELQRFA